MNHLLKTITLMSILGSGVLLTGCDLTGAESGEIGESGEIDGIVSSDSRVCRVIDALDSYCKLNEFEQQMCTSADTTLPSCHAIQPLRREAEQRTAAIFPNRAADGGLGNAFKHAYWNALMAAYFGDFVAFKFGSAHEFHCNDYNIGYHPDSPDCDYPARQMDLWNNTKGRAAGVGFYKPDTTGTTPSVPEALVEQTVLIMLEEGELRALHKSIGGMIPTSHPDVLP